MTTPGLDLCVKLTRSDTKRRLVTGWAYVTEDADGKVVEDFKRAIIPTDVLDEAIVEYMRGGQAMAGILHMRDTDGTKVAVGELVESLMFTREKWDALGGKPPGAPTAGWLVTHYITNDEVLAMIERGDLPDLSIAGIAEVSYVED